MVQYLTTEWLTAASAALAGHPGREDPLVLEYVVRGGADHHLVWDERGIRLVDGRHDNPLVTFTLDYATAAAIHRGDLSMQEAVISARALITGDLHALRTAESPPVGALDTLRADTTY